MRSSSREEVVGVFDALRAGFKRALDLRCDALTTPERLALLHSCEEIRRLLPAVEHPLINQLRANKPVTDINDLTLACGPNHKLADQGWTTRKNAHGDTEWIPPAHLDHGQPRTNTYHHPEKLLRDDEFP